MTPDTRDRVDIAVAGAGVAGLAVALAIAASPGPRRSVMIVDPALGRPAPPPSLRAVAIAPASRHFLERLGVWTAVESTAHPITRMTIGDSRPGAIPPPRFLRFGEETANAPLAHMVVQDRLRSVLLDACHDRGVLWRATTIDAPAVTRGSVRLGPDGAVASLLVAADGGQSRLRDAAGIQTVGADYGQTAIVATLAHERDHAGEAVQYFLPGGPLALLPMRAADGTGRRTSIVWTERHAAAERLMALPADAFCAALATCGAQDRGPFQLEDAPVSLPLAVRLARRLVAPRLALLGDAARTIHPLAGQGLNLGLQDAEALSVRVADALSLGLDPGAPRLLAAYQADRRPAQVAMAAATDALNRLFSNDDGALRLIRDLGLGLVDRAAPVKRLLVRHAAGFE